MLYAAIKRLLAHAESLLVPPLARLYRPLLSGTRFIGITGSCGKTTAKELVADILGQQDRSHRSFDSNNKFFSVARTILELRPRHRHCVIELGASEPGSLTRSIALLRPQIAVVTTIGNDHYKAFRGAKAVAAEKQQLVSTLPADGIAILNKDDPLVMEMQNVCRGKVISYGLDKSADVCGEIVESRWPDHLTLNVTHQDRTVLVKTQLRGAHLAGPVLAAFATGVACGVPLDEAAAAVSNVAPVFGRMTSETLHGGVTFIHDHFKAPLWTMDAVISYLGSARAKRTIIVIGTVSDYGGDAAKKYNRLAEKALECVDQVVFASRYAPSHLRILRETFPDRLHLFSATQAAAEFVGGFVASGDLVLLKGSLRADHLERIPMYYESSVHCWRNSCGREIFCDQCDLKETPEPNG